MSNRYALCQDGKLEPDISGCEIYADCAEKMRGDNITKCFEIQKFFSVFITVRYSCHTIQHICVDFRGGCGRVPGEWAV